MNAGSQRKQHNEGHDRMEQAARRSKLNPALRCMELLKQSAAKIDTCILLNTRAVLMPLVPGSDL